MCFWVVKCGLTKKVEDIKNRRAPRDITELRAFLGMTGYYRCFIKGYGAICKPLHNLLKKGGFQWGAEQEQAFQELKQKLITSPILALPDFE
mgnify:CR=1 FL=1